MKIYQHLQIGEYHLNHCEDSLQISEIGTGKTLLAVADGCSSGMDSHFTSGLICKILKKLSIEIGYFEFASGQNLSLKTTQQKILKGLFETLKSLRNQLLLKEEELLSTLILALVSTEKEAEIITIGDGLVCHNGIWVECEQGDCPDYLGYHLDENFDDWFAAQTQFLSFSNFEDLSISSDGIFTFQDFNNKIYPPIEENELIDLLLKNQVGLDSDNFLKKQVLRIEREFGLKPMDDLGILRVVF